MTEPIGNDLRRVESAINNAIKLAEADRPMEAAELLAGMVNLFPKAASLRAYLGWALSESGRQKEAIAQSHRATRLAPRSEKASLIHFHTLCRANRHVEALDEMKRFLRTNPSEYYKNLIRGWDLLLAGGQGRSRKERNRGSQEKPKKSVRRSKRE
jgi:predicted Zn-dependent protease